MSNRPAAVRRSLRNREQGFLLLEVLLAATCFAALCAALVPAVSGVRQYYYKTQVRVAAEAFAADMRELQQETMFSCATYSKMLYVTSGDKGSYSIYTSGLNSPLCKKVTFAELGCADVYFSQQLTSASFYKNGSPKNNGTYVLKHNYLPGFSCKISLQPVTGRVTVTDYGG